MAKFILIPAGLAAVTRQKGVLGQLEANGHVIEGRVRSLGPFDEADPGEHYVDLVHTTTGVEDGVGRARVNAFKYTSGFIEFGTEDTPVFAPLRMAAEEVGPLRGGREAATE